MEEWDVYRVNSYRKVPSRKDISVTVFDLTIINATCDLEDVLDKNNESAVAKHHTPEELARSRVILQPSKCKNCKRVGERKNNRIYNSIHNESEEAYLVCSSNITSKRWQMRYSL